MDGEAASLKSHSAATGMSPGLQGALYPLQVTAVWREVLTPRLLPAGLEPVLTSTPEHHHCWSHGQHPHITCDSVPTLGP